jgi:hypothetical protein
MSSASASEAVQSAEERPAKSSSEKKAGDGDTPGTTIQYPNAFRTAVIATGVACALFAVSHIRSTLLFTNFSLILALGRTGHGT